MISLITGSIVCKKNSTITILTKSGMGYDIHVSIPFFATIQTGVELMVYTHFKVSENGMELFGFQSVDEKVFFELLLMVKGVGPRGALNILGLGSIREIKYAIARGDVTYLTQVSGMGKKTAERLCVELKSKVGQAIEGEDSSAESDALGEVVEALVGMGYSKEDARTAIQTVDTGQKSTEELLKETLKSLSK